MQRYLRKLPKDIQGLLHLAGQIAVKMHLRAYLVGGCVRDIMINPERAQANRRIDLDIVVEGNAISFAEILSKKLRAGLTRHRRFGTATLVVNPKLKVDLATLRKEFYPHPASLPEVIPGTLRDDLFRRDFTINAMAISISKDNFGKIFDFFGARQDLKKRKIRVLHDLSFIDDPTRILRAVRFEQRLYFKIEAHTLKLLKEAVKLKLLKKTQPQRLRAELILILKEKEPWRQIKRLNEIAGFSFLSRHMPIGNKDYHLFSLIAREINWFNRQQRRRRPLDAWLIYLIGLLESLSIPRLKTVCSRYAFSKSEEKRILSYKISGLKVVRKLSRGKIKPSEVHRLLEPFSYEVILMLKAKNKNLLLQKRIKDFFALYHGMRLNICGEDLQKSGLASGPAYAKIFKKLLHAKLNGVVKKKAEEFALMKRLIAKERITP